MSPEPAPLLAVDGLVKRFGGFRALDALSFQRRRRRNSRPGRTERVRQDHLHQCHLRPLSARRRRDPFRGALDRRLGVAPARPCRNQSHLPGAAAVPHPDRARERRDRDRLRSQSRTPWRCRDAAFLARSCRVRRSARRPAQQRASKDARPGARAWRPARGCCWSTSLPRALIPRSSSAWRSS